MSWTDFTAFFRQATHPPTGPPIDPFPYQRLLAEGPLPALLHVPTGAGKTAAVTLGWIWRRRFHTDRSVRAQTPRRLVYCLPMRILVEQTCNSVQTYLDSLGLSGEGGIRLHQLLGGNADDDWISHPEAEAILVGTQDMLLSRALNRGYGLSRFRWPQPFGLLHSDSFWVFDETQLFGAGLPTTAQLAAMRRRFGVFGPSHTLWMSATLQPDWLKTVDHPKPPPEAILRLGKADRENELLQARLHAPKEVRELHLPGGAKDTRALGAAAAAQHLPGTLTLVVLNTVGRAVAVWEAAAKGLPAPGKGGAAPDLLLLHSRFRPPDRRRKIAHLASKWPAGGRIVFSTQVVEAGVDISARTLLTDLAPWPSIVQRLGRCNRYGTDEAATVRWVDLGEKESAPYRAEELTSARHILRETEGRSAAPANLPDPAIKSEAWDVLRAADLRDLFDTAPDLSGNDIDVARFIREADDLDVHLFWRDWAGDAPDAEEPGPSRDELCPAPLGEVRRFLTERRLQAWRWDHLTEHWRKASGSDVRPGVTLMLHRASGGYSPESGWNPRVPGPVTVEARPGAREETPGTDARSTGSRHWQSLTEHTDQVVAELAAMLPKLDLPALSPYTEALQKAARWHDAGKAHPVFQATMLAGVVGDEKNRRSETIWAKSPGRGRHSRRHFRHELASVLALLQQARELPERDRNLAAFLVAAHHGKVRLSIRALPREDRPTGDNYPEGTRYALGIWEGDPPLPSANLGGDVEMPSTALSLSLMELGRATNGEPSWLERTLALRDAADLGPFRLAYLEALLRAADVRASAQAGEEAGG